VPGYRIHFDHPLAQNTYSTAEVRYNVTAFSRPSIERSIFTCLNAKRNAASLAFYAAPSLLPFMPSWTSCPSHRRDSILAWKHMHIGVNRDARQAVPERLDDDLDSPGEYEEPLLSRRPFPKTLLLNNAKENQRVFRAPFGRPMQKPRMVRGEFGQGDDVQYCRADVAGPGRWERDLRSIRCHCDVPRCLQQAPWITLSHECLQRVWKRCLLRRLDGSAHRSSFDCRSIS
jgi:hypothetical protein